MKGTKECVHCFEVGIPNGLTSVRKHPTDARFQYQDSIYGYTHVILEFIHYAIVAMPKPRVAVAVGVSWL